jgi:SPP1 gp7 family putative phage head morphogenesis protein
MSKEMSQIITQGLVDGSHERSIARRLANVIDISRPRAEAIVRTEIVYTHAEAMLDTYEILGVNQVNVMAEYNTAGDDRVCGRCAALEGIIMTIQEARSLIPRHPNCITGDMVVDAPGTKAMMRSLYTGDIYDITDTLGKRVSVTSNHILLTQRGWVFAKDIRKSDNLIDASGLYSGSAGEHNNLSEPTVEDVFSSLVELSDESRVSETLAMPEHLHGDGQFIKDKIQIINTEGVSGDERETSICGDVVKRSLQMRNPPIHSEIHDGLGSLHLGLTRLGATTDSLMSGLGISDVLLARSPLHHEPVSLGKVTQLDPLASQHPIHCGSTCSKVGCNRVDRLSSGVPSNDLLTGEIGRTDSCRAGRRSILLEEFRDVLSGSSGSLGYGSDGQSLFTELREIESISVRHVVDLPVYDLSTESTLYNCNGFVSSNCRCSWLPANIGETRFRGQVVQRRNKKDIQERIRRSLLAERKGKISLEEAISIAKWPGARLLE